MVDVTIPEDDWRKLRASALFYVPELMRIDAARRIDRAELMMESRAQAAAAKDDKLALSPAALTNLLGPRPLGHAKCVAAILAFNALSSRSPQPERIDFAAVTGALFVAPHLDRQMKAARLSSQHLSSLAGAGLDDQLIIDEMVMGKRVTLTVGVRIARLMQAAGVKLDLRDFLMVRHDRGEATPPRRGNDFLFRSSDVQPAEVTAPGWTDWSIPSNLPAGVP